MLKLIISLVVPTQLFLQHGAAKSCISSVGIKTTSSSREFPWLEASMVKEKTLSHVNFYIFNWKNTNIVFAIPKASSLRDLSF